MKVKLLILFVIVGVLSATCNKSGYGSTPTLTFKAVTTNILAPNEEIEFQLNYTTGTGNIQSHIYVQKVTKNCSASNFSELDSIPSSVPTLKNSKGEIDLDYAYGPNLGPEPIGEPQCAGQNDTCVFRFALTDKAGHTSDTVTSPVVILLHR